MTASATAHDTGADDGEAYCREAMLDIYRCYLEGDGARARQDAHLDSEVTIWDAEQEPLMRGLSGLAAMRANRAPDAERPVDLVTVDPVTTRFGDVVVCRHLLVVVYADADRRDERMRVTCVWHRGGDGWRIVHSHEDLLPDAGGAPNE